MNDIVEHLRDELAKRKNPWKETDDKGKTVWKDKLYTPIILMPMDVMEILRIIDNDKT